MTVGIVMTVGYYRLPSWAYCENGLEHQNTAPFNKCYGSVHVSPKLRSAELRARLPLSFVRQRSRKALRLQADAELCNSIRASTTACRGVQDRYIA